MYYRINQTVPIINKDNTITNLKITNVKTLMNESHKRIGYEYKLSDGNWYPEVFIVQSITKYNDFNKFHIGQHVIIKRRYYWKDENAIMIIRDIKQCSNDKQSYLLSDHEWHFSEELLAYHSVNLIAVEKFKYELGQQVMVNINNEYHKFLIKGRKHNLTLHCNNYYLSDGICYLERELIL